MTNNIRTRFAPSPTGYLHIGGARTALFNYLFANNDANNNESSKGEFILRIEDTDQERSTKEAIDAIFAGLEWLGLDFDGEVIMQSENINRHQQVAQQLIDSGRAYYCYLSENELNELREQCHKEGKAMRSPYRDSDYSNGGIEDNNARPVVRIKAPDNDIIINDLVQGQVKFGAEQLDDLVLLRADGTPTYMLAVVVDDHDEQITHIIRGDDHLNNSARQKMIYDALNWPAPEFAHIPLIHGEDGKKLSKRHGAVGVEHFRDELGILPEAMRNYLLRLGWADGDKEIIDDNEAKQLFSLSGIGRSPSRLDSKKLLHINQHYISIADDNRLINLIMPKLQEEYEVNEQKLSMLNQGFDELKSRAKSTIDLIELSAIYLADEFQPQDDKAQKIYDDDSNHQYIADIIPLISDITAENWHRDYIFTQIKQYAELKEQKIGAIAAPLRVALTGKSNAPSVFDIMEVLGKDLSISRITQFNS